MEITYDQGSEILVHKFKNSLIQQEYGIKSNPRSLVNPTLNAILEWIQPVLGNLVLAYKVQETYVEKYGLWMGILSVSAFTIHYTANILKGYTPVQLIFGRDMILLIKHNSDWEVICHRKRAQINKYNNHKNMKIVDRD